MKVLFRVLVLIFGITGVPTSSFAESGWFWQNPPHGGNPFFAVATVRASTIVAVGDGGIILRSSDGGATWTLQASGTIEFLLGVSFVDADTRTAVGVGTILRTTNGGATWTPQASPTRNVLQGVSFVGASIGTVVGKGGAILRTTTGGE